MSTIKTIGTIGIMIACFAVIYPRFMHPLVLRAFGLNDPSKKDADDNMMYPPGFKGKTHPPEKKTDSVTEDLKRHMRHGPHPGMRAAAEMQRQQSQQGSGRGMMGVVLPMYAIGIVLYLVYTLFKVFNKSKGNNSWSGQGNNTYSRQREPSQDRMGFPTDYDGSSGDVKNFLQDRQQRKDLEDLLSRVDDKNVSVEEMRILQRRLEETEAQMTRILHAMQSVQTNVDHMAGQEMAGDPAPAAGSTTTPLSKSSDSSPDLDSYEVVNKTEDGKKVGQDEDDRVHEGKKEIDVPDGEKRKKEGKEATEEQKEVNLDGIDTEEEEEKESSQGNDEGEEEEGKEASDPEENTDSKIPDMKENGDSSVRQRKPKSEEDKD